MYVKINKSSGLIEYDDNENSWEADIIFLSDEKSVIILGTSHKLNEKERSEIITEILNKYFFGNYLNREEHVYMYKLKNRNSDKKEELNVREKAYSMLAETIIELPKNIEEDEKITHFRNIYLSLKLAVEEALSNKKVLLDNIDYNFYGGFMDFTRYKKIVSDILPEFEYSLTKLYGREIKIEYTAKYQKKESIFSFNIEEV